MKNLVRIALFFLAVALSMGAKAQETFDVAGVWTGEIYNDSTQKYIPFELAISRRSGELSGYSYTVFLIDSVENIGVKEVTVSEKKGIYIIKDKRLIDDNYSDRPAKGVYTTLELTHSQNDTADILSGRWFTNKTRQFYPLSGTVFVTKKRAIYQTRIVQRLSYLGLANRLSFVQPDHGNDPVIAAKRPEIKPQQEEMITIVEPEMVIELPKKDKDKDIAMPTMDALAGMMDSVVRQQAASGTPDPAPAATSEKPTSESGQKGKAAQDEMVVAPKPSVGERKPQIALRPDTTDSKKEERLPNQEVAERKANNLPPSGNGSQLRDTFKPQVAMVKPVPAPVVKDLSKRKIETISSVEVLNDSIVLSLFDNSTIDGDTVSVLLNGKVIVSKIGLLATAYNHTIHLTPDMGDSIKLILYAENLGSIPPNTGLLVVRDGNKNHEIRFSGDLKNNSAIILRRNKKQ